MAANIDDLGARPIKQELLSVGSDIADLGARPYVAQTNVQAPSEPVPSIEPEAGLLQKAVNVAEPIIAFGSGLRKGITDVGADVGGLITEVLGKLTPNLAKRLSKTGIAITTALNKADETLAGEAQRNYPVLSALGKGTGYVSGLTTASIAGNTGVVGNLATQGTLGSAMAGEGNRLVGGAGAMILPLAASKIASAPGTYLSSSLAQEPQIKNVVSTINKSPTKYVKSDGTPMNIYEATDEAFSQFRFVPGKVITDGAVSSIDDFVKVQGSNLSKKQMVSLQELKEDLLKATNLEDFHQARKAFTKSFDKIFLKGDDALYGKGRAAVFKVKTDVENLLQDNAQKLGALPQYKEANQLFKQSQEADIINEAFDKTKLPEGGNQWLNFNRHILKLKKSESAKLSPETKDMLTGVQKTLYEANHLLGIRTRELGIVNLGLSVLKGMVNNPVGRALLIKAGSPGGREILKALTESLVNKMQAEIIKSSTSSEK